MKAYPSIPSSNGNSFYEFDAYIFDKIDGSNLRMEWTKKRGWFKFGTRTRLFDSTDSVFAKAIPLWKNGTGVALEQIAIDNKWQHLIAYAEFWGPKSFAGTHELEDQHHLTLFDICIDKKGILGPRDFLRFCDKLDTARYLGQKRWTRGFVDCVKRGEIEGVTFEGVVGKGGTGHELRRAKAKTQVWIDAVRGRLDPIIAQQILNS